LRVWIDIENPPQVQYLTPLADAFEQAGAEVTVTARNVGITLPLLRERGVAFHHVGEAFGAKKRQKALGLARRVGALRKLLRNGPRPSAHVSSSRPAALAARLMGTPSFIVCDYEHVDLRPYRLAASHLLYPEVIAAEAFAGQGFARDRLIPFPGLKEDISFAGIDVDAAPPHEFDTEAGLVRVLFRPPAEESHYYSSRSGALSLSLLGHLAGNEQVVVIYSPRYSWQSEHLDRFRWTNAPIKLEAPVPFVSLLKGVDLVISSGGSMLREAAWLGVPACSIFQSKLGAVDRHLNSIGRLELISSPDQFDRLRLTKLERRAARLEVSGVPERVVGEVVERVA
jgi:predicted glycosyltransferase